MYLLHICTLMFTLYINVYIYNNDIVKLYKYIPQKVSRVLSLITCTAYLHRNTPVRLRLLYDDGLYICVAMQLYYIFIKWQLCLIYWNEMVLWCRADYVSFIIHDVEHQHRLAREPGEGQIMEGKKQLVPKPVGQMLSGPIWSYGDLIFEETIIILDMEIQTNIIFHIKLLKQW